MKLRIKTLFILYLVGIFLLAMRPNVAAFSIIKGALLAEPLVTEKATTLKSKNCEVELNATYGYDKWTYDEIPDVEYSRWTIKTPLEVRYGILDDLEGLLEIPFISWKRTVDMVGSSDSESESGFGQIGIGGKYNFYASEKTSTWLALVFKTELPTGDIDKGLGQGLNYVIEFLGTEIRKPYRGSINLGYIIRTEFTQESTGTEMDIDLGDPIFYNLAFEYLLKDYSFVGELAGTSFNKSKIQGVKQAETNGSTLDLVIGLAYGKNPIKLKGGVAIAVGDETYRTHDWKIILGSSYIF